MSRKPLGKGKRAEAERAAEWYLRERCGCIHTRRAVRTQWQKVDFWAADVVGKRADGSHVYAQATTGGDEALRTRRRKLEQYAWHVSDMVMVLQLTATPNPANRRRKEWWFRVHVYNHGSRVWQDVVAHRVYAGWFKAWKAAEAAGGGG